MGSLGDRFGAYRALLARNSLGETGRRRMSIPASNTAPPVIMTFTILRDGTIREYPSEDQQWENAALDRSAERALYDVGKVEPLPAAYERDKAESSFGSN